MVLARRGLCGQVAVHRKLVLESIGMRWSGWRSPVEGNSKQAAGHVVVAATDRAAAVVVDSTVLFHPAVAGSNPDRGHGGHPAVHTWLARH